MADRHPLPDRRRGRPGLPDTCPDWRPASIEPSRRSRVQSRPQRYTLGQAEAEERPMTVLIYVDSSKQVGDRDHLKVFANQDAAETWFQEHDPEGVAFEYEVME